MASWTEAVEQQKIESGGEKLARICWRRYMTDDVIQQPKASKLII